MQYLWGWSRSALSLLLPVLQPWLLWPSGHSLALARPAQAGLVSAVFLVGPCGHVPQPDHHRQQQGAPREH